MIKTYNKIRKWTAEESTPVKNSIISVYIDLYPAESFEIINENYAAMQWGFLPCSFSD